MPVKFTLQNNKFTGVVILRLADFQHPVLDEFDALLGGHGSGC